MHLSEFATCSGFCDTYGSSWLWFASNQARHSGSACWTVSNGFLTDLFDGSLTMTAHDKARRLLIADLPSHGTVRQQTDWCNGRQNEALFLRFLETTALSSEGGSFTGEARRRPTFLNRWRLSGRVPVVWSLHFLKLRFIMSCSSCSSQGSVLTVWFFFSSVSLFLGFECSLAPSPTWFILPWTALSVCRFTGLVVAVTRFVLMPASSLVLFLGVVFLDCDWRFVLFGGLLIQFHLLD